MAIPEITAHNLKMYIQHGQYPGSFLTSVLSNDVFTAMEFADDENKAALGELVHAIKWKSPIGCYGNAEKVQAWMAEKRKLAR